jgi:K+-transporting ATPase ATPase B chain
MTRLVEGARRQKTPNEIALTALLAILTLIFVIVVAAMAPVASYLGAQINIADLIALLVALIPTTIGALLSAIGVAGIDRTMRFNVLAKTGKAVEAAGDEHTLLLDKTGTVTVGNRQAIELIALQGCAAGELAQASLLASCFDTTPEGRTIVALGERLGAKRDQTLDGARNLDFSAETHMSGADLADGPSRQWSSMQPSISARRSQRNWERSPEKLPTKERRRSPFRWTGGFSGSSSFPTC